MRCAPLILLLALLADAAHACYPLRGGAPQTLTVPGCYIAETPIQDTITINGPNIQVLMNGHDLGCRGYWRGTMIRVVWGPGFIFDGNGATITGCDWGIDAYSGGPSGAGQVYRNFTCDGAGTRCIQADSDRALVEGVLAENIGPSRHPGVCLSIGIELRGVSTTVRNSIVRDVDTVGPLPSCEAVGISLSGTGRWRGVGGIIINSTVENPGVTPEEDRHMGIWIGGLWATETRLVEVDVSGFWDGVRGRQVRLHDSNITADGGELVQGQW